jgi:UDP-N-acetylglucosamine/UDP-N-acetylgalactosamine diphosphorylase
VCTTEFEAKLKYHVAKKKIKHIDLSTNEIVTPSKPNGIKLELFIFDIFPFLPVGTKETPFAVFEVPRSLDFSPLKNAPGTGVDCPESSRRDLFVQSLKMLTDAGAKVDASPKAKETLKLKETVVDGAVTKEVEKDVDVVIIEISPVVSYAGEDLSTVVKGKTLKLSGPTYIATVDDLKKLIA